MKIPHPHIKLYENSPKYSAGWVMKQMLEKWDREKEHKILIKSALDNSHIFTTLNTSNAIKRYISRKH